MAARNLAQPKRRAFLEAYAQVGNLSAAAKLSSVGRRDHYRWIKHDKRYAKDFEDANEQACDRLETEARRRATQGWDEPVYGKLPGKETGSGQVGIIRKFSDTLLIFLLKGARPDKYRERWQGAVTVDGDLKVTLHEAHERVLGKLARLAASRTSGISG